MKSEKERERDTGREEGAGDECGACGMKRITDQMVDIVV